MKPNLPCPHPIFLAIDGLASLGRSVNEIKKNKTANSDTPLAGESELAEKAQLALNKSHARTHYINDERNGTVTNLS